ncbi:MAG: SH3 domain-containing protein [Sulfurovum sp.]|nr:SH3 domain-containing protein [Sulfurovum sp.]
MCFKRLFSLSLLVLFSLSLLHADYVLKLSKRKPSRIDHMPKGMVADMKRIPQDPAYYAKQIKPWPRMRQKRADEQFNRKYFKPWTLRKLDIPLKDFGWEIRFVSKNKIYTASGKPIPASVYKKWIRNANYSAKDSKRYHAITTERTNVHALPTSQAFYLDPRKPGEGFPFNYNQNSALHMNVPLYVSHFSRDKKWAFVRASYAFGWVKVKDIAFVDDKFIRRFKNGNYAMTIKDDLRLYDEKGKPVSFVKLGTLFPVAKDGKRYLAAARSATGQALIKKVQVRTPGIIAKKPLPFTAHNVAKIAKEFYNEPYGWGGGYGCRDCSATTRDFMGVFGIFLRRNSSKQAEDGQSVYIKGMPKQAKKKRIIQEAEPFRSLLYVPGHIVLYLGQYKGEPVIMHTYWGIRKNDGTKLITGRTIITTTEPGKERSDVREKSKLINTLKTIVKF